MQNDSMPEATSDSTPQAPEAPKEKTNVRPLVLHEKNQQIVARDQAELYRLINVFMQGNAFPKTLDTPAKAVAAWQVAASLGLPPMVCMANLAIINGSIAMWGQLPKALAERTGEMEDFQIFLIDKAQKRISQEAGNLGEEPWGAVCRVKRKGRALNEYVFTENDAKRAGLLNKSGPWKEYRPVMYQRRATAFAMKMEFPDALMGVPVAEYDLDAAPDLKDVSPRGDDRSNEIANKIRAVGASRSHNESESQQPRESGKE